jgi:hypothetical protein
MREGYNGWKNRPTWNIALWIGNDEGLYRVACEYVKQAKRVSYSRFVEFAFLVGERTPDGVSFTGKRLARAELTAMLTELV